MRYGDRFPTPFGNYQKCGELSSRILDFHPVNILVGVSVFMMHFKNQYTFLPEEYWIILKYSFSAFENDFMTVLTNQD